MSRFGAKWKTAAGREGDEAEGSETELRGYKPGIVEEPAPPIAPTVCYVLEREGGGWRPSIYEIDPRALVKHGKRIHTHEPDLRALAWEQIARHFEERSK